jgi:hypothetical protein
MSVGTLLFILRRNKNVKVGVLVLLYYMDPLEGLKKSTTPSQKKGTYMHKIVI